MNHKTSHSVWISWNDQKPKQYDFESLQELNAFLKGVAEAAGDTQYTQFDSLDEYNHQEDGESGDYISREECIKDETHLTSCDDNGFCNFCGEV